MSDNQTHFIVPFKFYFGTLLALLVLTIITVLASRIEFGVFNVYIALFIAVIKASHDFEILNTVATRIIEVSPLGMIDRNSSFDDYMQSEQVQKQRKKLYPET